MIKKKKNFLLNLLFKSKNVYGESFKNINQDMIPFIYGIRNNYTIIDLENLSFYLKRIFKLLEFTLKQKQKILIIGNTQDIKFLINQNFTKKNKNIMFFNKEWVNGLITNNIIKKKDKKLSSLIYKNKFKLIIIIKNSIEDHYLYKELSFFNAPIISFLNTNQNLKKVDYPLVCNSKNIKSLYTLMYLFRKIF